MKISQHINPDSFLKNRLRFSFRFLLLAMVVIYSVNTSAQNITAYNDYRKYLQAFDSGQVHQVEYLQVQSYKIGGNAIAYVDNRSDFKIFYNGRSYMQLNAIDFSYSVSNNLVSYKVGSVLYVFDQGEKKTLSYYNNGLTSLNDSLLVYYDDSKYSMSIYYNGKDTELESSFLEPPRLVKTGPNVVAWVNQSGFFKVFYHGKISTLDNVTPVSFEVGRDIVAYVDDYTRNFHLFYYGDTARAEEVAPDSYSMGYGIMAYTDYENNFRVFFDGKTQRLLSSKPDFFSVKGNVIVYAYNSMFNVWFDGKVTTLENYTPRDYQVGINGVAWIDENGRLKYFDRGTVYTASYEIIKKYLLTGNVLKFDVGNNTVGVFFQGKAW